MFMTATLPQFVEFDVSTNSNGRDAALRTRRARASARPCAGVKSDWANSSLSFGMLTGFEPTWSFAVREATARLSVLRDGWDGPGSKAIANRALFKAESLVREALEGRLSALPPYLVPGGDGSIQIEWHERDGEIEFLIDPNGDLYIWGQSHLSGHEFEAEGDDALALFARWAPRLAAGIHDEVDVPVQENEIATIAA